jgi:adenosine kinase
VDCGGVSVSELRHTARFICTTDADQAQIASFYAGAMSEAREIELAPLAARRGHLDLVVIGANDPEAMLRHTEECRARGYAFAADPSQQLAFADGPFIRRLVEGATWLFSNEYEASLTEQKTGWSAEDILRRVGSRVTTLGRRGVRIERLGEPVVEVPVAQELRKADPTGVGDAFRAGFLAGLSWGLGPRRCAEVGSMLATYVIETVGTQEYEIARGGFLERFTDAYGEEAAAEVGPHLALVPA